MMQVKVAGEAGDDWMLEALVRCDEDGRSREEMKEEIEMIREGIIAAIEDYNEGRPDHMRLNFGECKGDFIDPDAGEWKPYGAWNYRGDLVFVCEDIAECRTMLGRIEADEALQERGWGEDDEDDEE